MKTHAHSSIEALEARIAPAGFATTFTDVDGDLVTLKVSKGTLADAVLTKSVSGMGEQLQMLDLSAAVFAGADVTFTAKPQTVWGDLHGDGLVNVGVINALGRALGKVTLPGDLGRITAGDAVTGLGALSIGSLGHLGATTGATDFSSVLSGAVGKIKIATDLDGTTAAAGARIFVTNTLGALTVGGSVLGGAGVLSGSVTVGNSLGPVKIGHDLQGGGGNESGKISTGGTLASVTIGGSVLGGSGSENTAPALLGQIHSSGDMGMVKITGSLQGGAGERSGQIKSLGKLAGVTIGGSVIGGSVFDAGSIISTLAMGPIKIAHDVKGGTGDRSGRIHSNGTLSSVTIGGSLLGGGADETGEILADIFLGKVFIGGDIRGGDVAGTAASNGAGAVYSDRVGSVTVLGSIFAGVNSGSGLLANSGAIHAAHDLGSVVVKGGLIGNASNPVRIVALGQTAQSGSDVAIKSVSVAGNVQFAEILAGYNSDTSTLARGVATNGDAQIGAVTIGGDFISSSIIAGLDAGSGGAFGDAGDTLISPGSATIFASIASVAIKGQALGTAAAGDAAHYGIGAQFVGAVTVGKTKVPLLGGKSNDTFAAGKAQILGSTLGTANLDGFDLHVFEV